MNEVGKPDIWIEASSRNNLFGSEIDSIFCGNQDSMTNVLNVLNKCLTIPSLNDAATFRQRLLCHPVFMMMSSN